MAARAQTLHAISTGRNLRIRTKGTRFERTICAVSKRDAKRYETTLLMRSDVLEEEQDQELARLEAFLEKNGATDFQCMVRGRQRIAYPIHGDWYGIYVRCTYEAPPSAVRALEQHMAAPVAGDAAKNVVRQMTLKV